MEQEYTIGTGTKIFYGTLAVGLLGFGLFLFSIKGSVSQPVYILPLLMIAGAVLIAINIIRRKIIIYDDRIICISLFKNKELALADIKGCRIGEKVIYLESSLNDGSKITISNYIDFGNSDDLVAWVKDNFKDLDATDLEDEKNRVLNDNAIGATETERASVLKKAKQIATAYTVGGIVVGFYSIFFDSNWSLIILICYPLLSILVMATSKGLIKFLSNAKRSVYGSTMLGFFIPSMVSFVKSTNSYALLQLNNVWVPVLATAFIICILLYFTGINKSVEAVKGQVVFMLILSLIYSFAVVIGTNCVFDKSIPQNYKATIIDKHISHGKHTSYYLTLSQWGPIHDEKNEDVGRTFYYDKRIGDTVSIRLRDGLLNIPWYTIYR